MLSNVRCPECQHKFWIQEGEMGSRQTCPACQAQFFAGASVAEARAKVGAPNAAPPAGYNKTMIGESAPVIKYNCPRCKTPLEGEAGSKKNCPSCTQRHQVPAASKPEPAVAGAGLNKTMLVGNESAAPPRPPIKYNCPNPNCNKPLEAPAEQGGTKMNCPACSQRLQIPAAPPVVAGLNKTRLATDASAAPVSALQAASSAAGVSGSSPAAAAPAPPASPSAPLFTPTNVLLSILVVLILLLVVPAVLRGGKSDEINHEALAKAQMELEMLKKEIATSQQLMVKQTKEEGDARRQYDEAMRKSREDDERRREEDRQRLARINDDEQKAVFKRRMDQEQQDRERRRQEEDNRSRQRLEDATRKLEDTKRALEASQQKTTVIQQAPPPTVIYQPYQPRYYWPWHWGW